MRQASLKLREDLWLNQANVTKRHIFLVTFDGDHSNHPIGTVSDARSCFSCLVPMQLSAGV